MRPTLQNTNKFHPRQIAELRCVSTCFLTRQSVTKPLNGKQEACTGLWCSMQATALQRKKPFSHGRRTKTTSRSLLQGWPMCKVGEFVCTEVWRTELLNLLSFCYRSRLSLLSTNCYVVWRALQTLRSIAFENVWARFDCTSKRTEDLELSVSFSANLVFQIKILPNCDKK